MAILPLFATALGSLAYPLGAIAQTTVESCPQDIEVAGEDSGNWTLYDDWSELLGCNEKPILFRSDATADSLSSGAASDIRACTSLRGEAMPDLDDLWNKTRANSEGASRDIQVSWSGPSADTVPEQAATALRETGIYISINTADEVENPVSLFAHYGDTAVGVYFGEDVDKSSAVHAVIQEAILRVEGEEVGGSFIFQYCAEERPRMALGISVNADGGEAGIEAVLGSVALWEQGDCVPDLENSDVIAGVSISTARGVNSGSETASLEPTSVTEASGSISGGPSVSLESSSTPAEVSATTSESSSTTSETSTTAGDDSETARNDAVTASETPEITSDSSLASTGEDSATTGEEPSAAPTTTPSQVNNPIDAVNSSFTDFMQLQAPPTQNADGSCAFYYVRRNENCAGIASAHGLEADDITRFNEGKTWGFRQCEGMPYDIFICLSEGSPPLPPAELGVQCGPKVPGTELPADGTSLADLNPCPLNVCCSQYGYCGTTDEFCEITGDVLGISGCLSNCERGITNNGEPPDEFISVGYFESWSEGRPCLNMGIDEIDTDSLTHVHFAFGNVTSELEIDMGGVLAEPFEKFVQLQGVKRIMSLGGWSDPSDAEASQVWRDAAASPRVRAQLAQNIVSFVVEYGLDGVDIDWEYPAAAEVPDLSGEPTEGQGYLSLLALLRLLLPEGKSLSIAAPASYWFLRAYPLQEMAEHLDYIVFMTYDLHGQWDAGESSQAGCPSGGCLRSHVDYAETIDALSMITRAGVPSSKVVVGITSYGRSFLMAEPGCTGPTCHFLGDNLISPAKAGPCTGEPGIIANAEIEAIIDTDPEAETWYDSGTMSDYLVYDEVQWVAYMDAETKARRTGLYRALNFGGVSDWAVDLQAFGRNESVPPDVFTEVSEGDE